MNELRLLHKSSLFQHIGNHSSWPGAEWTNCSDVNFPLGHEPWPWSYVPIYGKAPARISTTLKLYHPDSISKLYAMTDFLLAAEGSLGENFSQLLSLCLLVTSNQSTDVLVKEMILKLQKVPSLLKPCSEAHCPNPFPEAK